MLDSRAGIIIPPAPLWTTARGPHEKQAMCGVNAASSSTCQRRVSSQAPEKNTNETSHVHDKFIILQLLRNECKTSKRWLEDIT